MELVVTEISLCQSACLDIILNPASIKKSFFERRILIAPHFALLLLLIDHSGLPAGIFLFSNYQRGVGVGLPW